MEKECAAGRIWWKLKPGSPFETCSDGVFADRLVFVSDVPLFHMAETEQNALFCALFRGLIQPKIAHWDGLDHSLKFGEPRILKQPDEHKPKNHKAMCTILYEGGLDLPDFFEAINLQAVSYEKRAEAESMINESLTETPQEVKDMLFSGDTIHELVIAASSFFQEYIAGNPIEWERV